MSKITRFWPKDPESRNHVLDSKYTRKIEDKVQKFVDEIFDMIDDDNWSAVSRYAFQSIICQKVMINMVKKNTERAIKDRK